MKTIIFITCFCFLISANFIFSQNTGKPKNSLIPDKFTIIYAVNLTDSMNPDFMQNYPGNSLTDIILGRIFNSEVAAFDYSPYENKIYDTLSLTEVNEKLGGGKEEIYIEDLETGEPILQEIVTTFNPLDIVKYQFYEEWILDVKTFKFTKNIIAYSPIRKFYGGDDFEQIEPRYKLGFTIFNDKRGQLKPLKADKWTLVNKAVYEVILREKLSIDDTELNESLTKLQYEDYMNFENENIPFFSSVTHQNMAQLFYKKAMDQNTIAFDMSGFYKNKNEINEAFGIRYDDIVLYDEETGNEVVQRIKTDFKPEEIRSLLFFEDWYINESTLQFDKRITAVAPIRYYLRDEAEGEYKKVPCLIYTNNEDKERLEKLYYKLILLNYYSVSISHIELFHNLGKQSKSTDFKAFCQEKQNDLYAYVLKNDLSLDEKVQLYLLSEKINLGYSLEKLTDIPLVGLHSLYNRFTSTIDTCTNKNDMFQYTNYLKVIGEKILMIEDNCTNRINLLRIYEKLNLKTEIVKYQQSDKPAWLDECVADYYLKSGNTEKIKIGLSIYEKVFANGLSCKALKTYLELPDEISPKNIDINDFIENQDEMELACFASYLNDKHYYTSDSIKKIEILTTSEKVYTKILQLVVEKDYLMGMLHTKLKLNKAFDYNLINQLDDPNDILEMLTDIFVGISSDKSIPQRDLKACKPVIDNLVTLNLSENYLWTLTYSMFRWKTWSEEKESKIYSAYLETLLNRLLIMDPNSPAYLFSKYELQLDKGENPDLNILLNNNNKDNLELFAKFFGEGFSEYIFTEYDTDSIKYNETYLQNAIIFYDKLINIQPDNKEYVHNLAEVYYKLSWHYLVLNENKKALDSALKINKIENNNDNGIMATIFAYLSSNQVSKAYKITNLYKAKQCSTQVPFWDFFKYNTEILLSYKPNNAELIKYLEYLKK